MTLESSQCDFEIYTSYQTIYLVNGYKMDKFGSQAMLHDGVELS